MSVLRGSPRLLAIAASVAVTAFAAGCGGGPAAPAGGARQETSGPVAAFDAKVRADVDAALAAQTEQTNPVPAEGPAVVPGKKLVIIPCAMAVEGCARPARAAQEAAKVLGWEASIDDPAGDASKMSAAIKRAVSSGAHGIVLNSIDAAAVQGDLRAARKAGLSVVCDMCGDTGGLIQSVSPPLEENERAGYLLAQQAYLLTKERFGSAPRFIVMLDDEFATVRARAAGVKRFIGDCEAAGAGCELAAEGRHLAAEISTTAPSRVVQLARSNPRHNVLFAGYDAALHFFAQGLRQAGLADPAKVIGISVDADVANTDDIRKGGFQAASAGVAMRRVGYGMVDDLNRLFSGGQPVAQGISVKLITKANAPASGSWDGDFDATPHYLKLWAKP
ncbi:MAG: monosaccharide transporter substrate-binding protein family [Nonomuraea muscovyensis]|nr:monosaccharide transporter substrate-binding protein family [Nonomuraea muscovyensis]